MKKNGINRIAMGVGCFAACVGLAAAAAPGAVAASGSPRTASASPDIHNGEDLEIVPPGTGFQRWNIVEFSGTMGDAWLCLTNASSYCAAYNTNLTPGTRVWAESNGTADTQALWIPDNNEGTVCDGQSGSRCNGQYGPFTNHSLDKTYNGDPVLNIYPQTPVATVALANNSSGNPAIDRISSGGTLWVDTTNVSNMQLVNVEKSDSYGSAQVLTAP